MSSSKKPSTSTNSFSRRTRITQAPDSPRATSPDPLQHHQHHHSHYHYRNLNVRTKSQLNHQSHPRFTVPKAGDMFKSATNHQRHTSYYQPDYDLSIYQNSTNNNNNDRLAHSFSASDGEKTTDVETRSESYPSNNKSRSRDYQNSSDRQLRELRRVSKTVLPKSQPILIPSRGHDLQPPVLGPTPKYRRRQPTREVKGQPPLRLTRRSISSSSSESD